MRVLRLTFHRTDLDNSVAPDETCVSPWLFRVILRNYFSIFAIDTRWIYMKFAQKMYRLFVYEMCEYQDQGRIIVI